MAFYLLLLLFSFASFGDSFKDSRVSSFSIIENAPKTKITTDIVTKLGKSISCTLEYATGKNVHMGSKRETEVVKVQVENEEGKDNAPEKLISEVKNACASLNSGYWTYDICLNGRLKQSHGPDIYELGTFTKFDKATNTMLFENGQPCGTNPRSAKVKFACHEGAYQTEFVSIEEPSMCNYVVTMASASMCKNAIFPKSRGKQEMNVHGNLPESAVTDGHEDWFMQLSESNSGIVTCSLHSLENLKREEAVLNLVHFTLELTQEIDTKTLVMRRPGRETIPMDQVTIVDNVKISTNNKFEGKLSYVRVSTRE